MDVTNVFKIEVFKTNVQLFYYLPIKKEETENKQKVQLYDTKQS